MQVYHEIYQRKCDIHFTVNKLLHAFDCTTFNLSYMVTIPGTENSVFEVLLLISINWDSGAGDLTHVPRFSPSFIGLTDEIHRKLVEGLGKRVLHVLARRFTPGLAFFSVVICSYLHVHYRNAKLIAEDLDLVILKADALTILGKVRKSIVANQFDCTVAGGNEEIVRSSTNVFYVVEGGRKSNLTSTKEILMSYRNAANALHAGAMYKEAEGACI